MLAQLLHVKLFPQKEDSDSKLTLSRPRPRLEGPIQGSVQQNLAEINPTNSLGKKANLICAKYP